MDEGTRQDPDRPAPDGHQYRVTYDRKGWTHPRWQYFATEERAEQFVADFLEPRDDVAPASWVKVHRRPVGTWEPLRDEHFAA